MTGATVQYRVSFRSRRASPPRPVEQPPDESEKAAPRAKRTRLASQLALGHLIEQAIDVGDLVDYADAATRFGITRARVSQVVALTLLAPEIQGRIVAGDVAVSERELREVVAEANWGKQWRALTRRDRRGR